MHRLSNRRPGLLDETAADLAKALSTDISQLETEAEKLKTEIAQLAEIADAAVVG